MCCVLVLVSWAVGLQAGIQALTCAAVSDFAAGCVDFKQVAAEATCAGVDCSGLQTRLACAPFRHVGSSCCL